MTGHGGHLAVIADCERALGRPERAVDLYRATDAAKLDPGEAVALLIVAAGARAPRGSGCGRARPRHPSQGAGQGTPGNRATALRTEDAQGTSDGCWPFGLVMGRWCDRWT